MRKLLLTTCYFLICFNLFSTRWYITPTGAGNYAGTSWANAANASQIQALINNSGPGDSLFFAAGVYKPAYNQNPNTSIQLRSNLKIFGGFPQPSNLFPNPAWSNKNSKLHATVFSGDLYNDDINADGDFRNQTADSLIGLNSYHIFSGNLVTNTCLIDGCVIVGGKGSPYGGAFYNYYYSSPTLSNCYIVGNQAHHGGGLYNYDHSSPIIFNCVITGNEAEDGAGMYNYYASNPAIVHTQILSNHALDDGGGLFNMYVYPTYVNTIIANNHAERGGAIYDNASYMILSGCIIYQNVAETGGGVYNQGSTMTFNNCIIAQNTATISGGGMTNAGISNPKIRNSIVWDNFAPLHKNFDNGNNNPLIYYSLIEAPYPGNCISCQGSNGNVNPQFVKIQDGDGPDNIWLTGDDGLRLKPCSQGINTGSNIYVPGAVNIDPRGRNRILQQIVDIGVYENGDFEGEGYFTTLNAPNTALTACEECTDNNGWTHYYDTLSKKMVLSVFKNGYNIGQIGDGVFQVTNFTSTNYGSGNSSPINAPYVQNGNWRVMNRWWNVVPHPQLPMGNSGVKVRTYTSNQDTIDLNGALNGNIPFTALHFYKINGFSSSLDPNNDGNCNDAHAGVLAAPTYHSDGYREYEYSASVSSLDTWKKGFFNGIRYAEYGVVSFSGGGGGGAINGGGAFPIVLQSFEGSIVKKGNHLTWLTAEEMAGGHFVIEKSDNGKDFEEIGSTPVLGRGLTANQYQFLDEKPFMGKNYYRLRLTDFNGYTEYSTMVELIYEEIVFTVYPNPAQNKVYIQGTFPDRCTLDIYDILGMNIYSEKLSPHKLNSLAVSELANGVYYFQLRTQEGSVLETQKVIIKN